MNQPNEIYSEIFSHEAFIRLGNDLCFTDGNTVFCEMTAMTLPQLIGKSVCDVLPDLINLSTYQALHTAMNSRYYVCNSDFYPSLNRWLEHHIYPTPYGLSVLIRDISEQKNAGLQLQQSYDKQHQLIVHLLQQIETERTALARELHDELGQQLTVLKMDLSWLSKKDTDKIETVSQKLKDMLALADYTINTVRKISARLRPSMLDDLGLAEAMENLCNGFEKRTGIKINFTSGLTYQKFSAALSTGLYRILQEGLTNVERHAQATVVNVSLQVENDKIILRIRDNGTGFEINSVENKKTLGILGIQKQTTMIGGRYFLDSTSGQGTGLEVSVPVTGSD